MIKTNKYYIMKDIEFSVPMNWMMIEKKKADFRGDVEEAMIIA